MKNIDKAVELWEHIRGADFVLALPESDARLNDKIRSAFISKLGNRRGVILENDDARYLLELYSLYAFTDKLIIGSFDLPNGRKLGNLLESGVATEDEVIQLLFIGGLCNES